MSNLETRKEVASLAYALEHFDEDANILALQQAWVAGFETAEKGIWISVEEVIPEDDRIVLIKVKDQRRMDGNSAIKNGDKVKYRMGLTFTYVGQDPIKKDHSYCIHPTTNRIDSLPTEDLSTFLGHDYTNEEVIQKILNRVL